MNIQNESLEQNVARWIAAQEKRNSRPAWHEDEYIPGQQPRVPLTREQQFTEDLQEASINNILHHGYSNDMAVQDFKDLKLEYPKMYEAARLKNEAANNKLQERIAFDMDRYRDDADPWTVQGMKDLENISSVPIGYEEQPTFNHEGNDARGMNVKLEFGKPKVYMFGDNPDLFDLAHEGRHAAVKYGGNLWNLGGASEEGANRLVDYNLAERWGMLDKEMETGKYLEHMKKNGIIPSQLDVMQYQKQYGAPEKFNKPGQGEYELTDKNLKGRSAEQIYNLYKDADKYHNPVLEMNNEFGVNLEKGRGTRLLRTGMKNPKSPWQELKDIWNR